MFTYWKIVRLTRVQLFSVSEQTFGHCDVRSRPTHKLALTTQTTMSSYRLTLWYQYFLLSESKLLVRTELSLDRRLQIHRKISEKWKKNEETKEEKKG
jgi:hypothetical protein